MLPKDWFISSRQRHQHILFSRMLPKTKVTLGLVLLNVTLNVVLLIFDGMMLDKCRNLKEDEDSIHEIEKQYEELCDQLPFTAIKATSTALTVLGVLSICNILAVMTITLMISITFLKSTPGNMQLALTFGITGTISISLLIPKAIYTQKIGKETGMQINKMLFLECLQNKFTNDIVSDKSASGRWNLYFITNKCCALNPVTSTTNDFDLTPWCTTSGSCQQTNSQIPKACCKNVNEVNYTSAASSCHEYVTYGTYHRQGCFSLWTNNIQHYSPFKQKRSALTKYGIVVAICQCLSAVISLGIILLTFLWQNEGG